MEAELSGIDRWEEVLDIDLQQDTRGRMGQGIREDGSTRQEPVGRSVDRQLFEDTAANIGLILRGLSESYHAQYAVTAGDGLTLWDPTCFPHPSIWRMREVVGALLA